MNRNEIARAVDEALTGPVYVGIIVFQGIVDDVRYSDDERAVERWMEQEMDLPAGITLSDWYTARAVWNGDDVSAEQMESAGINPDDPVPPDWYDDNYEDSLLTQAEFIGGES